MSTKEKFYKLYRAEKEDQITKLIKSLGMDNPKDWKAYGDNESNFSVIGNQSSNAERALIEKITNCVDAVMMRRCYEMGIDPKGDESPKSPKEALEKFFNIKNGDTSEITKDDEKKLGKEIMLIATSENCKPTEAKSRTHPNITIVDRGEGQTPEKLPSTILSLLKGNKQSIPFTQGNYNQGGSGALMYCGEEGYCLVISKRNLNIPKEFCDKKDSSINKWGWTLIRKEIRYGSKDPVYTYYAPNGEIPTIDEEELELLPEELDSKESKEYLNYNGSCKAFVPYRAGMDCGTVIKLYNYGLSKKGPVNGHLKYDLAAFINDTYLPVRFIDCRKNKSSNSVYFRGFKKIIEEDEKTKEKEKSLVYNRIDADFKVCNQEVVVHIYCCNKRKDGSLNAKNLINGSKAIKFCLGQQFQGGLTTRFLNSAGLGAIQENIIIVVEFPNITTKFKSDLFMADRERLYDKEPKRAVEKGLKDIILHSEELKEFRNYMVKKSSSDSEKDGGIVNEIIKEWVAKDPGITGLLLGNNIFDNNSSKLSLNKDGEENIDDKPDKKPRNNGGGSKEEELIETKYLPTYFEPILKCDENGTYKKQAYIDKGFRIRFKTDVQDNFFRRTKDIGEVEVVSDGKKIEGFSKIIQNGKVTLIFSKKVTGNKESIKNLNIILKSDGETLFENKIILEIVNVEEDNKPKAKAERTLGLPEHHFVKKEEWISGMNEDTAVLYINDMGKNQYYINIDNASLKNKLDLLKDEVDKEVYIQIYKYIMLFLAISVNNKKDINSKSDEKNEEVREEIATVTREYARFMFIGEKLIENLKSKIG